MPDSRILFITPASPFQESFGGQLRALQTYSALSRAGTVTVLQVTTEDQTTVPGEGCRSDMLPPIQAQATDSNLGIRSRRALDVHFMNVHGYAASESDRRRLWRYLHDFDVAWVLNCRTPNILQLWRWPKSHLDLDDLPSTYLLAQSRTVRSLPLRLKFRLRALLMRQRELMMQRRFPTLSVCSEEDRRYLGASPQIHVIPNGIQRPASPPKRQPVSNQIRLGFIGLYTYFPNQDGLNWFVSECWRPLLSLFPHARLRLVGRGTDGRLAPQAPNVDGLGWIENPEAEIASWSLMIIPIRIGAGTRVKLADAFSRKCPVVSTSFGAFGYGLSDGRELRIADRASDFASACAEVIRSPRQAAEMAERAWNAFLNHWTWDAIAPNISRALDDCLRRSEVFPKVPSKT